MPDDYTYGLIIASGSGSQSELMALLDNDDIQPGFTASYQTCKTVSLFPPLGGKMVDSAGLIQLNRKKSIGTTLSRFSGWASSIALTDI